MYSPNCINVHTEESHHPKFIVKQSLQIVDKDMMPLHQDLSGKKNTSCILKLKKMLQVTKAIK